MSAPGRAAPATGEDYVKRGRPGHWLKARVVMRARAHACTGSSWTSRPSLKTRIVDDGATPDLNIAYGKLLEPWYPVRTA